VREIANKLDCLSTSTLIRTERSATGDRRHARIVRAYATHFHTHVLALNEDRDGSRVEVLYESVRDLIGETLLQLRALCEDLDRACKFRQTHHSSVPWDVRHMSLAMERQEVMLADRKKVDVGHGDKFVGALLKRPREVL
jgi:hypothetical protein